MVREPYEIISTWQLEDLLPWYVYSVTRVMGLVTELAGDTFGDLQSPNTANP